MVASNSNAMHYVGVDVHQRRSSVCILDGQGKKVKEFSVKGNWAELLEQMSRAVPRPFRVCYEASCGYGYLHEKFAALAQCVQVAHPGQLRLIYRSKKKHDRIDARKLSQLLYMDLVPQVHVPSPQVRAWRSLIVYRNRLMNRRVGVKNQIRGLLRNLGITAPAGKRLWSGKGIKWLKQQALGELAEAALQRDMAVQELEDLNGRIRRVEKQLDPIARASPAVALLKTIPGVGVRTAEAVVAYIDDVKRFARNKQIGSYFGLVPCQDASADRNRLGHITRDGPAVVRKFLCEACWRGIRSSPTLRACFDRVMREDPERKKIALVACAHHLARVMGAMLRSGEVWRESVRPEDSEPAAAAAPAAPAAGAAAAAAAAICPSQDTAPLTSLPCAWEVVMRC
jgi:transposase